MQIGARLFEGPGPFLMGIVNATPDSFSDGGRFLDADAAKEGAVDIYAAPQQSLNAGLAGSNRGMFKRILIANRGEIACRIIKTARRLGIETVAVYSEADRDALHVEMADEAVPIGPPVAAESYLVIDKIIDACKQTGAEAVHPGYGFLAENAAFAAACEAAGLEILGLHGKREIKRYNNSSSAGLDLFHPSGILRPRHCRDYERQPGNKSNKRQIRCREINTAE